MTTIAWDGKTLAADSQIGFRGTKFAESNKLYVWNEPELKCDFYFAATGDIVNCHKLMEYHRFGKEPHFGNFDPDETKAQGLLIKKYHSKHFVEIFYVDDSCTSIPIPADQLIALGSGKDLALGAMAAGVNSARAVEIASIYDYYTGAPVRSLNIL